MGVSRHIDLPAEWSRQRQILGLSEHGGTLATPTSRVDHHDKYGGVEDN